MSILGQPDDRRRPRAGDLLAVARLYRPHGLRGEVRAKPLAPDVLDFEALITGTRPWLYCEGQDARRVRVHGIRPFRDGYLLFIEGFETRETARRLHGGELRVARGELPKLPEGWFWEADLIGFEVIDRRIGSVGQTAGLDTAAGLSWLRVEKSDGGEVAIPWNRALVLRVDLEAGRIEVDLPLDFPGIE